jgi:prepilin-type N-terminal cleavage/methylation domain-containing protein
MLQLKALLVHPHVVGVEKIAGIHTDVSLKVRNAVRSTPPSRLVTHRDNDGFTLVELVIVVLVIAILAAIAVPNMQAALMRARATEAVGDLQVLRVAVFQYVADNHQWPPDASVGVVPAGMADYLPEGWSMTKERYELNYDNWTSVGEVDFIAVTVEVNDTDFGSYVLDMLGPNAWTNGSFKFTWVLEWLN